MYYDDPSEMMLYMPEQLQMQFPKKGFYKPVESSKQRFCWDCEVTALNELNCFCCDKPFAEGTPFEYCEHRVRLGNSRLHMACDICRNKII